LSPGHAHGHNGDAQAHIFRSNADKTFTKLSGGLPAPLPYMPYALVTDPDIAGHIYAGMSNGDIWHSTNYGDSWTQLAVNVGHIQYRMIST
jgi:hypothetical protein